MSSSSELLELINTVSTTMGTSFSKFQGLPRSALQILPADNLKQLKMQSTTRSQYQIHNKRMKWNYRVYIHLCCPSIPRIPSVKTKLTTCNLTCSTSHQKRRGKKHYGKL
jgi:hypothetical protein